MVITKGIWLGEALHQNNIDITENTERDSMNRVRMMVPVTVVI